MPATKLHDRVFRYVHGRTLIYNTCWEDPRIDRQLLELDGSSRLVTITSAGCNVLDYLLDAPAAIFSVDVNYRQNALLELKRHFFRYSTFADLFRAFGKGVHPGFGKVFERFSRWMPDYARLFWEPRHDFFSGRGLRDSFYFRGGAGNIAFLLVQYLKRLGRSFREQLEDLLDCRDLGEQRRSYESIEPRIFSSPVRWGCRQPLTMSLLGVPRAQMEIIGRQYPEGLEGYIRSCLHRVFTEVPITDNYFWRVYLRGAYTPDCSPNYLKEENFDRLRDRSDRIHMSCNSLSGFLRDHPGKYSHFVLLDHQDWMARSDPAALEEEWRLILASSRPGTRILMRSAAARIDYIPAFARERLEECPEPAGSLHRLDRVGTYGCVMLSRIR